MNDKHKKLPLFWTAITVLSFGTLSGCEYCIPAMFALFTINVIYKVSSTLTGSVQIQTLN